ncbi:unnamed protein product [Lota lota]
MLTSRYTLARQEQSMVTRLQQENGLELLCQVILEQLKDTVLREKGQGLLEQVSSQPSLEVEDPPPAQTNDNVHHIHSVLEDMQLRKQRQPPSNR